MHTLSNKSFLTSSSISNSCERRVRFTDGVDVRLRDDDDFIPLPVTIPGRALAGVSLEGCCPTAMIDELLRYAKQTDDDPVPLTSTCISSTASSPTQCKVTGGWHNPFPPGAHQCGQDDPGEEDPDEIPDHAAAPAFVHDLMHMATTRRDFLMQPSY